VAIKAFQIKSNSNNIKMKEVIGSFYFRNEGDGCIMGKYLNQGMSTPLPECAKKSESTKELDFEGTYQTAWHAHGSANESMLEIKPRKGKFFLTWTDKKSEQVLFKGEAMIVEGLLVGSYWSI